MLKSKAELIFIKKLNKEMIIPQATPWSHKNENIFSVYKTLLFFYCTLLCLNNIHFLSQSSIIVIFDILLLATANFYLFSDILHIGLVVSRFVWIFSFKHSKILRYIFNSTFLPAKYFEVPVNWKNSRDKISGKLRADMSW